jgi:hypothetical protein
MKSEKCGVNCQSGFTCHSHLHCAKRSAVQVSLVTLEKNYGQ